MTDLPTRSMVTSFLAHSPISKSSLALSSRGGLVPALWLAEVFFL
jgi:hypothetical protein